MPRGAEQSAGGLSGLAAQFGIAAAGGTQSSVFYASLLTTRTILEALAESTYVGPDGRQQTLAHLFGVRSADSVAVRTALTSRLRRSVGTSVERGTGVIRYAVTTESPLLSRQIADRLMSEVNDYSVRSRRNRAAADRRFIEEQVALNLADLQRAENRVQEFLQRNRLYQNDPQLVFQHERLTRDLRMREQVYTGLAQALEQASLETARSTPTISVLEPPDTPLGPDSRRVLFRATLALIVGLFLGVSAAVAREYALSSSRREPGEFAEFQTLRRRLATTLRHPFRALRRQAS
jgi:uncharacterized protein involved in exopolysaccharide biosynthesis